MFDTGCTWSILKPIDLKEDGWIVNSQGFKSYATSKFQMRGRNVILNIANVSFIEIDIAKSFSEFDGILGMDFIEQFQFYIDYSKQFIYVNPI